MVFMCSFGLEIVALHETNRMLRSGWCKSAGFIARNPDTDCPLRRIFSSASSSPVRHDYRVSVRGQEREMLVRVPAKHAMVIMQLVEHNEFKILQESR
jgi:hypothetical protein